MHSKMALGPLKEFMQATAVHLKWLLHTNQTTLTIVDHSTFHQSALSRSNRHEDVGQNTKNTYSSYQQRQPTQSNGDEKIPFQSTGTQDWTTHKLELKVKDLHVFKSLNSVVKSPLSARSLGSPAKCHDQIPATYGETSPTFAQRFA